MTDNKLVTVAALVAATVLCVLGKLEGVAVLTLLAGILLPQPALPSKGEPDESA